MKKKILSATLLVSILFSLFSGISISTKAGFTPVYSIVVANTNNSSVDFFDISANGNIAPSRSIKGANTNLNRPLDAMLYDNELYILNHEAHAIEVFNPDASGNTAPVRRITGGMAYPSGFDFDTSEDEIFVANYGGDITVYNVSDSGAVSPKRTISKGNAMTLAVLGNELFVTTYTENVVYVYNKTTGVLLRAISGANTGFSNGLWGVAISGTELFIADSNNNAIKVFNTTDSGDVAPKRIITGASTLLGTPRELHIFNSKLYVANNSNVVTVYNITDNGNVAPLQTISGAATTFNAIQGVTIAQVDADGNSYWTDGWTADDSYTYGGGDGSSANPYRISTAAHLTQLSVNVRDIPSYSNDKYFKQTANIDLSGKKWTPINEFMGSFDGTGFKIQNITIDSNLDFQGFFGKCNSAMLIGIELVDCSITSTGAYVGALAGLVQNSTVTNCHSSGSITATGDIGGLLGGAYTGTVNVLNSYSTCSVTATAISDMSHAGGLIGTVSTGTIYVDKCFSTGDVIGGENSGGFIGIAYSSGGSLNITNCYETGNVASLKPNGWHNTGGIVGLGRMPLNITNCYASGLISSAGGTTKLGGIVGGNDGVFSITTTNSYYNSENAGGEGGGTPMSVTSVAGADMLDSDFDNTLNAAQIPLVWAYDSESINNGFPVLLWQIPAPTLQSTQTNTSGTVITLTFDKEMANPSGKQSQFSISSNGAAHAVMAASLNANTNKIDISLETAVTQGDTVTISYTAGDVESSDGYSLQSFTNQSVTNNAILNSPGNAAEFTSSSNSYITVADSNSLDATSSLTIEAWIKPDGGGEWALVLGKQLNSSDANPWYSYRLLAASANSGEKGFPRKVAFNIAPESSNEVGVSSNTVVDNGVWTHVAGVYDGTQLKIYINGILENSVPQTGNIQVSSLPLYIGKAPWTNYNNYNGQMDEVRIWSVARTQQQIAYDMKHKLSGSETGLVGYWSFDEGAGGTTGDITLNNNDAILNNEAGFVLSNAPIGAPYVTTGAVSDVSEDGATFAATVISEGLEDVTDRGFVYGTDELPTLSDSVITSGSGTGAFSETVTGLDANTTYHVRAYVSNSIGTVYGEDATFTTDEAPVETVLYSQGFESPGGQYSPPVGWNVISAYSIWQFQAPVTPAVSAHGGTNAATFKAYSFSSGTSGFLHQNVGVNLSSPEQYKLKFWMYHDTDWGGSNDRMEVKVSTDSGTSWSTLTTINRYKVASNAWEQHEIDLSAYAGNSNVRIGFNGISGYGYNIHIDDVVIARIGSDSTAPSLTAGTVSRLSDTQATVKFTSDEAGQYYYCVVSDGAAQPDIDTDDTGTACDTSEQTISINSLTAGAKDIYIVVKDSAGNISEKLKIDIDAYVAPTVYWTTGITAVDQYPFGGGDGSSQSTAYEISTAQQLAQLAYNVNQGNSYSNKYFKLTSDIDLSGKRWTPIGYRFYPGFELGFDGTFDGNNHKIQNLLIGTADDPKEGGEQTQAGLFGATKYNAILKNVDVYVNIYTDSVTSVGALVGYSESEETITDCKAYGSIVSTGGGDLRIGGLIGDSSGISVINCLSDVDIDCSGGTAIGGVIGYPGSYSASQPREVNGCIFTGNINSGNVPSYGGIGGIAGKSYGYITIVNCANKGEIIGAQGNVGGIVGIQHNDVVNCYSSGTVSSSGNYPPSWVGGITGYIDFGKVYNCYTSGQVSSTGSALVGAVVGYGNSGTLVSNCYFDGDINPTLAHVRSTAGNKTNLYEFTTLEMKGADPGENIVFSTIEYASGEEAFKKALNGWISVQTVYPDIDLAQWKTSDGLNEEYPYLKGIEYVGEGTNADLESIAVSGITLTPSFDSSVINYSAQVGNSISSASVTVVTDDILATTTINGSLGKTKDVTFNVGSNQVIIVVTAENQITTKTYTLSITRAQNTSSSGGGVSYASTSTSIVVTTQQTNNGTTNKTEIKAENSSGTATASVTSGIVNALLNKAESQGSTGKKDTLEVNVDTQDNINKLKISIGQNDFNKITQKTDTSLSLTSKFISVNFDDKALETISKASSGGNVVITSEIIDKSKLSESDKEKIKDRPVYDFTVTNGNTQVSSFGGGHATISVPYTLKPEENPNSVVVYYLADDGSLKTVRGKYDSNTKTVTFKTTHFSNFVIAYNPVGFNDVSTRAWYSDAVGFVAARSIATGTGDNNFSPDLKLTRAQFIVMVMRAYAIEEDLNPQDNFTDAGNAYYTGYLSAAKRLKISGGTGNNMFAPDKEITRQEMCVLLYNTLKTLGELPKTETAAISSFSDVDSVAPWAKDAMTLFVGTKIISGSDNKLSPADTATRAQMAQILYNLLSK